jgi:hypothetical protein
LDAYATTAPDPRGDVLAFLRDYVGQGLRTVNVDSAGIGWNFYLHLKDHLDGVEVVPVNVGEKPTTDEMAEKRINLKAELYMNLRERFESGEIDGITDSVVKGGLREASLTNQLAGIRYKHDSRGRVVIESKEDARKRGVKSPDRAEMLMLTYAPTSRDQRLVQMFRKAAVKR